MKTLASGRFVALSLTLLALAALLFLAYPLGGSAQSADPPARPTGLSLETATHDSITISWADAGDPSITGYQILRRDPNTDDHGVFAILVEDTGNTDMSYTDALGKRPYGLQSSFVYRVKAINEHGLSQRSTYLRVDAPPPPGGPLPSQPTGLEATATHETVTLSWDDPANNTITGYRVWRRDVAYVSFNRVGSFYVLEDDTGSSETSYVDDSVASMSRYDYKISALNDVGVGFQSETVTVTTPNDPSLPARPIGIAIDAMTHSAVGFSWDDPNDPEITGYQILRRDRAIHDYGVFEILVEDTGTSDTEYIDATVSEGGSYVYRVKAINSNGLSQWSTYARADVPTLEVAPIFVYFASEVPSETAALKGMDQNGEPMDPPPFNPNITPPERDENVGSLPMVSVATIGFSTIMVISNLVPDFDDTTLDLTLSVMVMDSANERAEGCEGIGMMEEKEVYDLESTVYNHEITVVTAAPLCTEGDYKMMASASVPGGDDPVTFDVSFGVTADGEPTFGDTE